jgi:uncharacterized membrane protein YdbT with pleckstrin-like domain
MVVDFSKKHSLGQRAFFTFFFKRISWVLLPVLFACVVWYADRWVPMLYSPWSDYITKILFLLCAAIFVFVLFETYMEYRYYTYLFADDAFIMTYGYVTRNEIATLYHHIQNVNIERSVLDRFIGVSKLIIIMVGSDRDSRKNQIVLPAVGRRKAKLVQGELLKRARRHASMAEEEE